MSRQRAKAFAPATVGNIAVGFDLLGHALDAVGDTVTIQRLDTPEVVIANILNADVPLPMDPEKNTATAGLVRLIAEKNLSFGFEVTIEKGIALGSGMGGSASSAAASIVAAEALLDEPLSALERFDYALTGEAVASGAAHGDNLAPALFGGIQLVTSIDPVRITPIPAPEGVVCALAHPHARLDTRKARAVLARDFDLHDFIHQSGLLAGFLAACFNNDLEMLEAHLADILIEPLRAPLIVGFEQVKQAALAEGALGCSISGAGPSVFAWCRGEEAGQRTLDAMSAAFRDAGFEVDAYLSPVDARCARLVDENQCPSSRPLLHEQIQGSRSDAFHEHGRSEHPGQRQRGDEPWPRAKRQAVRPERLPAVLPRRLRRARHHRRDRRQVIASILRG